MSTAPLTDYYYKFSANNPPQQKANSGDHLRFITQDCFTGLINTKEDLTTDFNYDRANPASGPVFIDGAEAGDVLLVEIIDIRVSSRGVVTTLPGCGPLAEWQEIRTKPLTINEGMVQFNDHSFPISPMIGVIGVAPANEHVPCGFPGPHGGNMDCKLIKKGAKVYLPVQVSGALLSIGDLHGVMGDGELCGTGLEICGEVDVKVTVLKQQPLSWPVLETPDKWYAIACAQDYPEALKQASRQLQTLIARRYEWDETDTYLYMSLQADVEICQACKPCAIDLIVRVGVPKRADKPLFQSEVKS
ncbi:acetamidase [[Pantoea] beijingensis]|uniref:Acetamidase n=1 Tax=[Pantoea] beijingensis TaxID=1324864 RepID=A0A443IHA7_9GAMM|nr:MULTISPECIES: acetamidase/formamidase family protein [Erwiniaceae]RWR03413.1 acetamidase [[Pantoea] beijingensis]